MHHACFSLDSDPFQDVKSFDDDYPCMLPNVLFAVPWLVAGADLL